MCVGTHLSPSRTHTDMACLGALTHAHKHTHTHTHTCRHDTVTHTHTHRHGMLTHTGMACSCTEFNIVIVGLAQLTVWSVP